jgi:hypothetical protein
LADSAESEFPELFRLPEPLQTEEKENEETDPTSDHWPTEIAAKPGEEIPSTSLTLQAAVGNAEKEDAEEAENAEESEVVALVKQPSTPWTSAAAAREFLERLAGGKNAAESGALARFLRARRGDVYLALAVILALAAIRWGIWSNHSVSATGNPAAAASHRKTDADLPFFDRVLIKLGIAEAPDAPEDKGNPDIQVWVDLRTALYYCPGNDLYGKSPKGKYETQRDAQLDQFEPANRKACN